MSGVTLEDVFAPLNDLDYPAAKEDVVRHAESRGASDDVLRALRALPLGEYASREELARSVDTEESGV
jgi:O6-methylguanine-DNA--protein-cysteine methyltransferase